MEYSSGSSSLSMSGGDDFTGITEVLDRAVLLDSVQTINSAKTFGAGYTQQFDGGVILNENTSNETTGVFSNQGNLNNIGTINNEATGTLTNDGTLNINGTLNLTTDIVADKASLNFTNTGSTIINPQNIMGIQIAGTDKLVTDAMNTALYATSQLSLSAGGSTNTTMTSANFNNNFSTQQTYQVNNATKLTLANTATTMNNTTTNIQSGGTNKITTNATTTTLNNDTTNIQSGGTNRVTIDGTTTGLNNTTTNIQSGGTNKIITNATTTTLNNDTTNIQSGGTNKLNITGTATTLANTTITLQDATPTTRFNQTNGQTTITNTNIGLTGITTATGAFIHTSNFTSQQPYGTFTAKSDNLRLQDTTGTTASETKYYHTTTTTNIANTTINLQDATPTTRFSQTNGTTTITNTNTGVVGNFTASRIFVGTIASNTPLLSFQLAGVKNGTATSGGLLLQPAYDNVGGQDIFNFQVPFPIRILKYVLMFDADSGTNTNLALSFYFKQGGNAGIRTFDYTETITTIVSSTRTNSQSGNINGTAGLDYTTADIISIDYASAPANEFTLILYAQQRG